MATAAAKRNARMRTSRQHELLGDPLHGHPAPDDKRFVVFLTQNVAPKEKAAVHTTFLGELPRRIAAACAGLRQVAFHGCWSAPLRKRIIASTAWASSSG